MVTRRNHQLSYLHISFIPAFDWITILMNAHSKTLKINFLHQRGVLSNDLPMAR